MIVPVLLPGLLGLFSVVPVSFQERPRHPRDPADKDQNREKLENLVKLPDDFVQFARVPEGGTSPRVGYKQGALALIFFKGEATQGDLYLTRSSDEAKTFLPGVRLNPEPGTVAAREGIHTGSVDLGPDGSAHVVWITKGDAPGLRYLRVAGGAAPAAPVDLGTPPGLCSTPALAVDASGQAYVFYAASDSGPEASDPPVLRVWMCRSSDGASFSAPVAIDKEGKSVSAQSAMDAHVDEGMGTIFVLYRTAYAMKEGVTSLSRGIRLLSSDDQGGEFKSKWVDNWKGTRDPRSSADLSQGPETTLATWDAGGQVFWATIRRQAKMVNLPMDPRFNGAEVVRTHPVGANGGNEVFMAWIENSKEDQATPPRLAWQIWLREGRAPIGSGYSPEAPGSGTPTVFPRKEHGFTVIY